jgi:hypothetical protein
VKNLIKYIIAAQLILLSGCSDKNHKLIFEEIYISKHFIGPVREGPGDPCTKGIIIFGAAYHPKLIIKVNKNGNINGYVKECSNKKEGYFEYKLSDSLFNYFKKQISEMTYKKKDTIYIGSGEGFTEYFISIKNGKEEKQIMLMQDYRELKGFRDFIDTLNNYANSLPLSGSYYIPFRKDSLVVLKTEKYWKWRYGK